MITLLLHLLRVLPFLFGGHRQLALESLALQLAVYKRTVTRPALRGTDRLFWVGLARVWAGWKQPLVIVTPDTRSVRKIRPGPGCAVVVPQYPAQPLLASNAGPPA